MKLIKAIAFYKNDNIHFNIPTCKIINHINNAWKYPIQFIQLFYEKCT